MTYERLIYLKFKKGLSTYELVRQFPNAVDQISTVALLDVPEPTLSEVISKPKIVAQLKRLKKKFFAETSRG